MKIYTKTGDTGTTALFGGRRISKGDLRIDSYGTVDELNSHIGLLMAEVNQEKLYEELLNIQSRLFTVGSNLASDPDKEMITPDIEDSDIEALERSIDEMSASLTPLKNFIMPSGSRAIAQAHVCRTVCRRAERLVVTLSSQSTVDNIVIRYLNRLSDYFFVVARYISHTSEIDSIAWVPKKN
jgi:cob(I)alamin adenosyltransferase